MEPENNKLLLVFLFWCIIFFNSARAICVPRNQSDPDLHSFHSSPPKSHPPPSPLHSSSTSASVPPKRPQETHDSSPAPSTAKSKASTTQSSQPKASSNGGAGAKTPKPPQKTPDSSPAPSTAKPKAPTTQSSQPKASSNGGAGAKTVSDPRIKSLCDKTDQPALCLSSIAPYFNGKTDVPSLIEMLIEAATDQTKQAIATAAKMAKDPKSSPKMVSRFDDCKEIYDDALDNLQEATDAIPLKDVGTISTMVSAAISDYGTCDDGFTGQPNPIPEGVSPMAKINENLMNIAGIILALTNMIP
ncbi:hypothetical protein DITRI_Ditri08aG0006200 [Diplodiscus trichospermus]